MVIDDDPGAGDVAPLDPSKKLKAPAKKVCFLFCFKLFFSKIYFVLYHKVPEKRPEVNLLKYLDIPSFVMESKYNYFQKVIAPATKHPKLEHPTDPQSKLYLFLSLAFALCLFLSLAYCVNFL